MMILVRRLRREMVFGFVIGLVAFCPHPAQASLVLNVNQTFNGGTATSATPWLIATFSDAGVNVVTLSLQASLEVSTEFIDSVVFNLDPTMVPSALSFIQNVGTSPTATITAGAQNAIDNVQGFGPFKDNWDLRIDFPTAGGPSNRFNGTDVANFTITGAGLTASSFNFLQGTSLSNPDRGPYHIGAHIQGIPIVSSGGAGDAVVPEPSSFALVGVALASLAGYRCRRKERAAA